MFEFKSKNYYYLLYLYYQILKDLGIFDKKLIITERKIDNLKEKINELFERNPTLNKYKYYDMFMIRNGEKNLETFLENIEIYFLIHIYIYLYSITSKNNYKELFKNNLILYKNNTTPKLISSIVNLYKKIYEESYSHTDIISKIYLFILLSKTTSDKTELTNYFNFIFSNMIIVLSNIKNISISIKYLFLVNNNYDTFLQIFKAVYPNPANIDIQYDLDEPLLLLPKGATREKSEKKQIFKFVQKEKKLLNHRITKDYYYKLIDIRAENKQVSNVNFTNLKIRLMEYIESYLIYYYENSLYINLNKSQKTLLQQILMKIIFMLKEENYDTPEFINSFNFLLANKYTINILLYTFINIIYSFYKNKKLSNSLDKVINDEIINIYKEYKREDFDEKPLLNTNDPSLNPKDREFLVEINRVTTEDRHFRVNISEHLSRLTLDNKLILFIQLLKSLYKIGKLRNKKIYDYFNLFIDDIDNIKIQKEKKPLTYLISTRKKLSTAAINRYPAISERLRTFQLESSTSESKSSSKKSSTRSSTRSSNESSSDTSTWTSGRSSGRSSQ